MTLEGMIEVAAKHISGNVYAIQVTKSSYVYVIKGSKSTLIDSGLHYPGSGNKILNGLKSINIKPGDVEQLFLTHHDLDHTGNAAMLQKAAGCRIWVSKEDMPYVTGEQKRPGIKRFFEVVSHVGRPEKVSAFDSDTMGEFRILKTPGHTPGHVCILYRDILFAGDLFLVKDRRLRFLSGAYTWDKEKLLESAKKLSQFSFSWICPGDSPPIRACDVIRDPAGGIDWI